MNCPHCHKEIENGSKFCIYCGAKLDGQEQPKASADVYCHACGTKNSATDKFCQNCGTALAPEQPESFEQPKAAAGMYADAPSYEEPAYQAKSDPYQQDTYNSQNYTKPSYPKEKTAKSKKGWIIGGCVAAVVVVAAIGGFFVFSSMSGSDTPEGLIITENRNYRVLKTSNIMDKAYSSSTIGSVEIGQDVYLTESVANDDGEEWGHLSDGGWILMGNNDYTYLYPSDTLDFSPTAEEKTYTVTQLSSVYSIPMSICEPVSQLTTGDEVYVYEIVRDGTEKWGRIGSNQWTCLSDSNADYLEVKEEPVVADASTSTDSKDTSSSSDTTDTSKSDTTITNNYTYNYGTDSSSSSSSSYTDTYARKPSNYTSGTYKLNYDMKIRSNASRNGDRVSGMKAGDTVKLVSFTYNSAYNAIWGELDYAGSGKWICVVDDEYTYLTKQ